MMVYDFYLKRGLEYEMEQQREKKITWKENGKEKKRKERIVVL